MHEKWARYGEQNPLAEHYLRTRDGRARRFSDLITRRELHRLELYHEIYRELGVEYQVAFTLPGRSQRILGVALSRRRRDFTVAEFELLTLARPYLIQAYRSALADTRIHNGAGRSRRRRSQGPWAHAAPSRGSAPGRDGTL